MELLEGMRNDCQEGNISWFPERQKTLRDLIGNYKPQSLIQIGFNMGHSALLICDAIASMILFSMVFSASARLAALSSG